MDRRIIAVASGKGGTGKTTVATNLARVAAMEGAQVSYLDCDVEEPSGHIFLKPEIENTLPICVPVPVVDEQKCTVCGRCADICQYGAIALLGDTVLTFPNLCHNCGGCKMVCSVGAITENEREIGTIQEGWAQTVRFVHGRLRIGEAKSPPLIRAVKERMPETGLVIIDAPPGTSCPVIRSVRGGRSRPSGHRAHAIRTARPQTGCRYAASARTAARGGSEPFGRRRFAHTRLLRRRRYRRCAADSRR